MKKQTIKLGNSAGVLLPKEWLNGIVEVKLVRPPINEKELLKELLEKLQKYLPNIIGIYLVGSYARNDHDTNSDIDILVITDKINKLIKIGNYEIILKSEETLKKTISNNLYLLSLIKEAKPLINKKLLEKYSKIKNNLNIKKIKKEIENMSNINKESIDFSIEYKQDLIDGIAYSLVLRLRELYLLKCIVKNKIPNKKELIGKIPKNVYEAYIRVKRNHKQLNNLNPKDAETTYNLIKKWLKELKD